MKLISYMHVKLNAEYKNLFYTHLRISWENGPQKSLRSLVFIFLSYQPCFFGYLSFLSCTVQMKAELCALGRGW